MKFYIALICLFLVAVHAQDPVEPSSESSESEEDARNQVSFSFSIFKCLIQTLDH